jgi:hypothetical protein
MGFAFFLGSDGPLDDDDVALISVGVRVGGGGGGGGGSVLVRMVEM